MGMKQVRTLQNAIDKLSAAFDKIKWKFEEVTCDGETEKIQLWPGDPNDEVMLCVFKGKNIEQIFHRQDYFFFNFAYCGDYTALSDRKDNRITVREGECYIGQPFAGYAPNGQSHEEIIIVGVLIQTQAFFKTFLHVLSFNAKLFRFFLEPQNDPCADDYVHLKFDCPGAVRSLLDLMIIEYANPQFGTQEVLKSLTLALLMQVARQYTKSYPSGECSCTADQIVQYIGEHFDTVTLAELAEHFSYHPNYISTLLTKELGKSFSELVLEQRMERAAAVLRGTQLPVSEIAELLGYRNTSNFYKAFREYYGMSPREFTAQAS